MAVFHINNDALLLDIKVVPGASKTCFAGLSDDRLRIKIAAAPEDGKANACLCAFLAQELDCRKKDVVLKTGEKSRLKTVSLPLETKEKLELLLKMLEEEK